MRLVGKHGTKRWAIISQELNKEVPGFRSGKQCRTRWLNHLDPGIKREPWSEQEENVIYEAQQRLGVDREITPGPHGQRHQEPLVLDDAAEHAAP